MQRLRRRRQRQVLMKILAGNSTMRSRSYVRRPHRFLILRYVHDYDLAQIAKTLGTTRGSVAVSLFRSRARLKKKIREMRTKP